MCSVGAHQQAQDHRSRSFGDAHARRLKAAAEHAHLSKYKACLNLKAWQVYWKSDAFPITAPKYISPDLSRYEKVGEKSVRFVGVDTEESGKDTPTAQSFPNKNHQLSDYCPMAIFLLALSLVALP